MMYYMPCAISVLRAFAVIPVLILFPQHPAIAFAIFAVAAASDFLDGFLARKFGSETEYGKTIDPIADKILYLGSLIALQGAAPTILLFIPALAFEVPLVIIRLIKPYCKNPAANPYGKIKTTAQFCAIAFMMLGVATEITQFIAFGFALGIIAIPLAWMSLYTHIYANKTAAS